MTNNVNFDELAAKSFAPGATSDDYERMFAAVFALSEWHFIAVGEPPNFSPYCALFPDSFGDAPAVAVFTDIERARKFMAESSNSFGSAAKPVVLNSGGIQMKFSSENLILSVPTENILDYVEKLIPKGVVKIFFNPNTDSHGFHHDLKMMRPIREHLESKNMLPKNGAKMIESIEAAPETTSSGSGKSVKAPEIASETDFDALSRKATETNSMEDLNELFGSAFALSEWQFIARGEAPNVNPYIASNAQYADNQPMIRAFTDSKRLIRFAKENNLTEADGSCKSLTIPTANIIPYLEQFIEQGAYGLWFNSDSESDGFFIPIKQLQPIKNHLAKINWQKKAAPETSIEILQFVVKEGLMLPSAQILPTSYSSNVFWRAPSDWLENGKIKAEYLSIFEKELSGGRSENVEGAFYVPVDYSVKIFSPAEIKITDWRTMREKSDESCTFFIISESGEVRKVTAEEFQAEIDASLQTTATAEVRRQQDNLANFGMSQTADGGFDLNLNINRVGAVNFNTAIAPFYEAVTPLLADYQGTGEYVTLLRFEPRGMSETVENVAENTHGAYLQIRRFLYLNPKNNVRIGVNSIHSNRLRHAQSNAELIVSFELCKNLDNQTAAFYYRFEGAKSEVFKLTAAIQPILESVGYQAVQ